jgi:hypothetical protein
MAPMPSPLGLCSITKTIKPTAENAQIASTTLLTVIIVANLSDDKFQQKVTLNYSL